ncbi:MAG: type II toxin-antitoxin system RelE/ParE family toxin [Xanthomonadales bacterium]|nr:type II toxin-antitoxin system RelE/ParE family toxin [Xanthomonadales bacterium]
MKVTLHPKAEQDVAAAAAFYQREGSPALAARFVAEFDRVARLLAASPGLGAPYSDERRMFPTTGFPYAIIYRVIPGGIRVLVVRHDRRRPGFGQGRR